jgi:hypothetical protein
MCISMCIFCDVFFMTGLLIGPFLLLDDWPFRFIGHVCFMSGPVLRVCGSSLRLCGLVLRVGVWSSLCPVTGEVRYYCGCGQ